MPDSAFITLGGEKYEISRLVKTLRAYRGRLTRREMTASLGLSGKMPYDKICKLCRDYGIAAKSRTRIG